MKAQGNLRFYSTVRSWKPVTEDKIYNILGLFLLMWILQKPATRMYFTRKGVISTPGFPDIICRDMFELICKFLDFVDDESKPRYHGPPKLFSIYPILSHFNRKFQTLNLPNQSIDFDESVTSWTKTGMILIQAGKPLKALELRLLNYVNEAQVVCGVFF